MRKKIVLLLILITCFSLSLKTAECKPPNNALKFKTYSCADREGIGMEAFKIMLPVGWKFQGGISWLNESPAMPAILAFKISNPAGTEALEFFRNRMFFWMNDPVFLSSFPVGSKYFGSEVCPPMDAVTYIKKIIIPRSRSNATGLKIVDEDSLPDLAKKLGIKQESQSGVYNTSSDGGKVRIEYMLGSRPVEEDIYALVQNTDFSIQSASGNINYTVWTADYQFSFMAPKGTLDRASKVLQSVFYSFKINPGWLNKYMQVIQYLTQNQIKKIQNMRQISSIISRTSNEINSIITDTVHQRQKTYDNMYDKFSQYIRGVEEYYDPYQKKPVELPNGYYSTWTNSLGEYVLSDDPTYDPNIGSSMEWQKMKKTP